MSEVYHDPSETATKRCRVCQEIKPLKQFTPSKECSLGVTGTCKKCSQDRVERNRATRALPTHRICTLCKIDKPIEAFPKDKARLSGYKERCKECIKPIMNQNSKRHYQNNPEQYRQRRQQNHEEKIAYFREYHNTHKEQHKIKNDRWRRNNLFIAKECGRRRAAKKKATVVKKISYKSILAKCGRWCHICNKPILTHHKLHFDHIIPLDRNGPHIEENIHPSHDICNHRKGTKLLSEMDAHLRRGPDDMLDWRE